MTARSSAASRASGATRQALPRLAMALALVVALGTMGASTTFAAKPTATDPWIQLAGVTSSTDTTTLTAAPPTLGAWVAFDSGYDRTIKYPRIQVLCYQDGVLVYGQAGSVDDAFQLGGGWSPWKDAGGSATCVADLYFFSYHRGVQTFNWLASTDPFEAVGT